MGWRYRTRLGAIAIIPQNNRFVIMLAGNALGSYHSPSAALDDLVMGAVPLPSGADSSRLGLPDDLSAWERF